MTPSSTRDGGILALVSASKIDPKEFRRACGKFATGVTIVTVKSADGAPHGLTVNSFTSVSLNPPLVLVCVDHRVRMLEHFLKRGYYGVNILAGQQQALSSQFARSGINRFGDVEWYEGRTGVPLLPGVLATLECKLIQSTPAGDHVILLGEVRHLELREGSPLAYFGGAYAEVQPADLQPPLEVVSPDCPERGVTPR